MPGIPSVLFRRTERCRTKSQSLFAHLHFDIDQATILPFVNVLDGGESDLAVMTGIWRENIIDPIARLGLNIGTRLAFIIGNGIGASDFLFLGHKIFRFVFMLNYHLQCVRKPARKNHERLTTVVGMVKVARKNE